MKNILYKLRLIIACLILILCILAVTGIFYPVKVLDLQFTPLLQRVFVDFSIISLSLLTLIIVITLLFGRIYCSMLCPLGIFQDLLLLIIKKEGEYRKNLPFKYFIAALSFGFLIGSNVLILRYTDPYTYFGSAVSLSLIGLIAIAVVIILTILKSRLFCTDICPVGAVLGLISKISIFKMYINKKECLSCGMCERNCPSGCIDLNEEEIDNVTCVKCLKCLPNCPKGALTFGIKPKEELKFNIKRRDFITTSAALVLFSGMIKAGVEFSKKAGSKIKDIILPPGSIDKKRMLNTCLNCNLCINSCPSKILSKADESFNAVHIDYSKGKRFCEFDCKKCSEVCPSGAIKRITLEEKQNTRIAMAVINQENCNSCEICINECPVNAITKQDNQKSVIDASKCIGCGKCKTVCGFNAIEVFAVNEQRVL